jgi:hypothetical protein
MTRNPVQLALLLCFLGVSTSPAEGLVWERTCIRITAQPGQRVINVDFPFRNEGGRTVALVSIETSCRCLAADVSRNTYNPGERGVVVAAFSVGNQKGSQEKSITVVTDEPDAKPVRLLLFVDIPGSPDGDGPAGKR